MSGIFFILMLGAMLAVLATLFIGLFSMARGGEFAAKYSNKLMRARVWLQGIAIVLFLLAVATASKG
jgi:hypothetical protein